MSILDGVSQCWWLSKNCGIDWEAWGVIATGAVGALSAGIAALAWKTSNQAAKIAASQHQAAVDLREGQARILGRLLLHEVVALTAKVQQHESTVSAFFADTGLPVRGWRNVRDELKALQRPLLPSAEMMIEQIHNLPDWLGADLATMISHSRDINDLARRIIDSIHEHRPAQGIAGIGVHYSYSGQKRAFDVLRDQLAEVRQLSIVFVEEFRTEVIRNDLAAEVARAEEPE